MRKRARGYVAIYTARHGKTIDLGALMREKEKKQEARNRKYASEVKHFFSTRQFNHFEDTVLFTLQQNGPDEENLMVGKYRDDDDEMNYPRSYEPYQNQHFYRVKHHRLGTQRYERSEREYLTLDRLVDTIVQHLEREQFRKEQKRVGEFMTPIYRPVLPVQF